MINKKEVCLSASRTEVSALAALTRSYPCKVTGQKVTPWEAHESLRGVLKQTDTQEGTIMQKPMPDWPKHIEAHRGPRGGAMYEEPGHPGHVFHRYIREDVVADMVESGHITYDFHIKMTAAE